MRLSQEGCTLGFVLASGGWRHWLWKRDGMGGCVRIMIPSLG